MKPLRNNTGYSLWMLLSTMAIVAVLATITLVKMHAYEKQSHQLSYVNKINSSALQQPTGVA